MLKIYKDYSQPKINPIGRMNTPVKNTTDNKITEGGIINNIKEEIRECFKQNSLSFLFDIKLFRYFISPPPSVFILTFLK